ncbi:hypothetical protein QQ045_025256 [Rhodiola kirilowii]
MFMYCDDNEQTRALEDESFSFVSVNGRNCWIPKCPDELKPRVGMTFPNLEKAVLFYKEYARIAGFVVRLATSNSSAEIITIKLRRDTRCGCQARIQLNIGEGGRYRVYFFAESHNHSLESDIGKQFLTSHREMSLIDKQLVMECGKVRIGATKAHHIRKELCGGFMNIGATVTDYKNFKRDLKLYIGFIDAQMVVDNLSDKIKTCPGYSFEYFLDEVGILTRLFWADVILIRDNMIFGDVVSFDSTYRMNKYNLVFVPFTGVDNQLRSVTLAAGLISKEDVDSCTWLLTCFMKLSEREPSVIVTDQDASMKAAIATIFPSSRHRFCMWHITEKLQAKKLEKHASETFSYPVFKKIQSEMSESAYGCAIQSINEDELGRMYIINDAARNSIVLVVKIPDYLVMGRWHIDASRKHNPGMFLVDHENPNQTREQIMLASEIWFHVNAAICSFKTDVDSIRKFHDHIYEYVKVHVSSGGAHCSVNNNDFFRAVLQMPQPAAVVVNNPGLSRNKGCGKRIRGPREIGIEKSKKPLRSCGYCNELGLHDKRTCPKRAENDSRMRGATSEHGDVNFTLLDYTHSI